MAWGTRLRRLMSQRTPDQIEESHDRTIDDPVFRSTMQPISVDDVEMADGKSITLDQGRQEPMHRVEIWEAQKDTTLAGVWITGSPNRLALCATALSGVIGIPASAPELDPATLPGIGGVRSGLGAEGASAPR